MSELVKKPLPPLSRISLIFACGTALFSDGYANGVIGAVNTLLKRIYGAKATEHNYSTTLSSVTFAGTVVGMLVFGWVSDRLGRKSGMMLAAAIVTLFSGLSAASQGANDATGGLLAMLITMRFFLGIGIGAEYPCGSVAASEQSEEEGISKKAQNRWFALATNSMIDFGWVVAAFVPLVLFWIFGEHHLRAVWRLSLGLGMIPSAAVFIWRIGMEEPTLYKKDSMARVKIPYWLIIKRYWGQLLAISMAWFIYDFVTYPFGIYSSTIVNNITNNSTSLSVVFGWSVVINLFDMPGTLIGAFTVDYLGPKYTMVSGLVCQAIIGFIMSGLYKQLTVHVGAFAVVYGIFLSFGEFGPGNCLGMLAAKSGPTAVRGQFYGIAAATGKVGAFAGTWAFPAMITDFGGADTDRGNTGPFWVGSALAIVSASIVFFFVRPLTADSMKKEDEEFRQYLADNGWDITQLGLGDTDSAETWTTSSEKEAEVVDEKIV